MKFSRETLHMQAWSSSFHGTERAIFHAAVPPRNIKKWLLWTYPELITNVPSDGFTKPKTKCILWNYSQTQ